MKDIFHFSSNIYKLWLLLCYLHVPFQLASPPGFHVAHIPEGNLVHIHECVFLAIRSFFLFRPRVFARTLGSVARREPVRTPHASLSPGRGPWHVLWGFKVARPLGEGFRARRAIQAPANPRTGLKRIRRLICCLVSRMPSISSDHTWWWKSFSPTPTCHTCDHF